MSIPLTIGAIGVGSDEEVGDESTVCGVGDSGCTSGSNFNAINVELGPEIDGVGSGDDVVPEVIVDGRANIDARNITDSAGPPDGVFGIAAGKAPLGTFAVGDDALPVGSKGRDFDPG